MKQSFPIMLYHRVGPLDGSFMDAYTVSPEAFAAQMEQLERDQWHPMSITAALEEGQEGTLARAVVITFDDGFASNREHAWPILRKYGFPAETFIVRGRMAQFNTWDRPEDAVWTLLSEEELRSAEPELMTFHSHSLTHVDLTTIPHDSQTLGKELDRSRDGHDGWQCNWGNGFAYPFGSWNWRVVEQVRNAGFSWACTCLEGLNSLKTDRFLLRRVEIEENDIGTRLTLKLRTGRNLLRWPPQRPSEIQLAKAWLSKALAKHGIPVRRSRLRTGSPSRLDRGGDEGSVRSTEDLP